jgi:hypothetical protein
MKHKPKYWPAFCNRSAIWLGRLRGLLIERGIRLQGSVRRVKGRTWITTRDAEEKMMNETRNVKTSRRVSRNFFSSSSLLIDRTIPANHASWRGGNSAITQPTEMCLRESLAIKSRASHNSVNSVIACHRGAVNKQIKQNSLFRRIMTHVAHV